MAASRKTTMATSRMRCSENYRWILFSYSDLEAAKRSQGARARNPAILFAFTPFLATVGAAESLYLHIAGLGRLSALTRTSKISSVPENGEKKREQRAAEEKEEVLLRPPEQDGH